MLYFSIIINVAALIGVAVVGRRLHRALRDGEPIHPELQAWRARTAHADPCSRCVDRNEYFDWCDYYDLGCADAITDCKRMPEKMTYSKAQKEQACIAGAAQRAEEAGK